MNHRCRSPRNTYGSACSMATKLFQALVVCLGGEQHLARIAFVAFRTRGGAWRIEATPYEQDQARSSGPCDTYQSSQRRSDHRRADSVRCGKFKAGSVARYEPPARTRTCLNAASEAVSNSYIHCHLQPPLQPLAAASTWPAYPGRLLGTL